MQQNELTSREKEILVLIGQGLSQKRVGEQLFISAETVKKHLQNCYKKLGAHNKLEALRKAGMFG
jgi:DNA-binding NarL/FixJ family response regulator